MRKTHLLFLIPCYLLLATCCSFADVPRLISYQGRLTNAVGVPITGSHRITFKLYTVASGGLAIWTENQTTTLNAEGLYNVMLGDSTNFPLSVDYSVAYWLGIAVDGGAEICRYQFGASPYALNIADVITKSADQVLETDLHLRSGTFGDRTIWFGDGNYVGVGEYPALDDDLLLYCTGNPAWLNALDFRPTTDNASDLGTGSYQWHDAYLSGRLYVDGLSPVNQYLGTDGSGNLAYLALPVGGDITAVGSMTSGDVFANSTADDDWLGLGASAGRIEFDDQATDEVNILDANVGIGTASPGAKLHINAGTVAGELTALRLSHFGFSLGDNVALEFLPTDALADVPAKIIAGSRAGTKTDLSFVTVDAGVQNERMKVTAEGYVGIGTTTPAAKLHCSGNGSYSYSGTAPTGDAYNVILQAPANGAGMFGGIKFNNTGNSQDRVAYIGAINESGANRKATLVFGTDEGGTRAEKMRITGDGNVGIGTTTPAYKLHVVGATADDAIEQALVYVNNTVTGDDDYGVYGKCKNSPEYGYGGYFEGGYVGVFGVADMSGGGRRYGVYGQASGGSDNYGVYGYASGAGTNWAGYFSSGNVHIQNNLGIGTTTPAYRLQLSTDSAAKPSTNTWTIPSDRRLKTDIEPFTDGIEAILKIEPIRYRYNGLAEMPTDKENIGVIAQDIQKICPYTVGTFSTKLNPNDAQDTELLDFNSHALTFVTINAIKELNAKIEQLSAENDSLKARIEKLEKAK